MRDARGRYLCGPCYDARVAHKVDPEPIGLRGDALDDIGYDIEPMAGMLASMATCPGCGVPIEAGTVVCVHCGYNAQTGKKIKAQVFNKPEEEGISALQQERLARNQAAIVAAYRTPTIMFVVGMIGMLGVYGAEGGMMAVMAYGVFFVVSLVIGLLVYLVCSAIWIGFDESPVLAFVRLAGIYSISNLVQVVLGYVPIPILPWLVAFGIYIELLMTMLDLDLNDAIILALLTFILKWIAVFTIIAALMNMFGLQGA